MIKIAKLKRILTFALALFAVISCFSCGKQSQEENNTLKIDESYVITRPSKATNSEKNSAKALREAYEAVGIRLNVLEDWYKSEGDIPEKEILIGDTNRPESAALKASLDNNTRWKIAASGNKLVIVAVSDMALSQAVKSFTRDFIEKEKGVSFISGSEIAFGANESNSLVEFLWEDGDESLIRSASWGPRVYTLSDKSMAAGVETSKGILTLYSTDNAKTWKEGSIASFRPDLACANVNFYEFEGKLYLAYRATGEREGGFYTSLQVSVSEDGGKSFKEHSTVCEYTEPQGAYRGVWEPCLGELGGRLTCFYANDSSSVTSLQNIEYMVWNGSSWGERTVVSEGAKHSSRDGMPVWTKLKDGGYALVIESSKYAGDGHPFIIQLLYSKDGKSWSEPVDIYTPSTRGSKAGAPGIVELPTGQLVISFQTDEDASEKGDSTSVMKTIISDGTSVDKIDSSCFTKSDNVFGTPDGEGSVWTGIWFCDRYLYASAGTSKGSSLKMICLF